MAVTDKFKELIHIVEILRSEKGCPWDRVQTHESLKPHMIEEAYEVCEGIEIAKEYENYENYENLCEELGDVLFQVIIHSQIAKENKEFTLEDVLEGICNKMIRRHPHVFNEKDRDDSKSDEALGQQWEEIKSREKQEKGEVNELNKIPKSFPALIRAQKVIKKAKKYTKEYDQYEMSKVNIIKNLEKLGKNDETKEANCCSDILGEIMLETVNLATFLQLNAENSLTNATNKFINRLIDDEHEAVANGAHLL